ncbi:MAG: DUF2029 domain-containing protein [Oligoflexia bacterium]|nr:DUF2029 domain-containing protein [Oligoflexia bacterium]
MKFLIPILTPLAIYTVLQQCFHTVNPWVKILALLILIFYFFYKKNIDEKFIDSLDKLSLLESKSKSKFKFRFRFRFRYFQNAIIAITLIIILLRIIQFGFRLNGDTTHIEDIATLNIKGINALFIEGKNPYSAEIDPYRVDIEYKDQQDNNKIKSKAVYYSGYKYMPLQLFFYAPFTLLFDLKGIYIANFIVYILIALICFFYLKKDSKDSKDSNESIVNGCMGVIAFLTTDFFFTLSFNKGTNDSLPTLFLLLSLIYCSSSERGKTKLSAVMLGISLLIKQFPGALLVLILTIQKKYRIVFLSMIILAIGVVPFLLSDFNSFMTQAIEFNLVRPVRETSIISYLPAMIGKLIPAFGIIIIVTLSIIGTINKESRLNIENGLALPTLTFIIFLITSKMTPTHYFVWVTPIIILWFFKIKRV